MGEIMSNCKYCGKEMIRGLPMHEKHCKGKTQEVIETIDVIPPTINNISTPVSPATPQKKKSLYWGYAAITVMMVVSAVLQYGLFSLLKINMLLLIAVYIFDFLIYAFLIWTIWRLRDKATMVVFDTMEEFIKTVPKWTIADRAPNKGIIGSVLNAGKEYKKLVIVSENFEPKTLWVEWNGFIFSTGNRGYVPAKDVRGDFFFYHADKKKALLDTAEVSQEDAEDSFQLDAVWNQGVAVGHAAAMSKSQGQIQLILILVACTIGLVLLFALYSYSQFGQIRADVENVRQIAANTTELIKYQEIYGQ